MILILRLLLLFLHVTLYAVTCSAAFIATPVKCPHVLLTQYPPPTSPILSTSSAALRHPSPLITTTATSTTTTTTTTTQLHWGVIVPVPEDFFTITGISLGFAYTILRSWNRVMVENVAWEKRLEDARLATLERQEEELLYSSSPSDVSSRSSFINRNDVYTELDLRKMDAAASKSVYGPDGTGRDEERMTATVRRGRGRKGVKVMDREEEEEEDEKSSDHVYSMTDQEINDFEEKYGIEYDPYYDEPYTVEELPDDMSFVEDKVYGDRRYENGEIFYRDERNRNLYWRQGGRPRLKQFWEIFS